MNAEDAELLADSKDAVRAVLRLAHELCDGMTLRLGTIPYDDDGRKLMLARAELEGARKLLVSLRAAVLTKKS